MAEAEDHEEITPDDVDPQRLSFRTVLEAYDQAEADFLGPLVFLDSGRKSAAESPYRRPSEVYEALQALYYVTKLWRSRGGVLGHSFKDELQTFNLEVHRISQNAATKWGDEYRFQYKGERRLFEEHVTLGGRRPDRCISIHWYRDEQERVTVIGYCGSHLRTSRA
jgi:hypothetical protein